MLILVKIALSIQVSHQEHKRITCNHYDYMNNKKTISIKM